MAEGCWDSLAELGHWLVRGWAWDSEGGCSDDRVAAGWGRAHGGQ